MTRWTRAIGFFVLTGISAFALVSCNASSSTNAPAEVRLQGAGATFPNPIYQKWFSEYNKLNPSSKFDYQSIGSGGGIKQVTARTVDFGGSDAPMKDEDLKAVSGPILHIPTVLGAVVVTYNLPDVTVKFTPEAIAGIFLGKVKKWNDPLLVSANAGVKLPDKEITVVHRSDGSGTTFVWTDYLAKVSPDWKSSTGTGVSVNWPVGVGAKGNEGVTGQVKQTPYSLGYVELIYALQNKLPAGAIKNADGEFVSPSLESITAAAASAAGQMPDDLRISITNAAGKDAYPISSFTYLLVYKDQSDQAKGKALVDFLWWATHDGEQMAKDLSYAPLPPEVVAKAEQKIKSINYQGKPFRS
jgi:phosphate transport system substrate-binding protein